MTMESPSPEPGLVSSRRRPRLPMRARCSRVRPGPSSETTIVSRLFWTRPVAGDSLDVKCHATARPLAGVVEEVAQHLLQVLTLALEARVGRAGRP